jgi:hypothetical protein
MQVQVDTTQIAALEDSMAMLTTLLAAAAVKHSDGKLQLSATDIAAVDGGGVTMETRDGITTVTFNP